MGREKGPQEYTGRNYVREKVFNYYFPLYNKVADFINYSVKEETIVDLGCGVGHMSRIFLERGISNYIGIDFSENMLNIAKEKYPETNFILFDLKGESVKDFIKNYRIFIMLEVLEHIENDKNVLLSIPKNSQVIFSVPNYDDPAHVRFFKDVEDVKNRYKDILKFIDCSVLSFPKKRKIFVCKTLKK